MERKFGCVRKKYGLAQTIHALQVSVEHKDISYFVRVSTEGADKCHRQLLVKVTHFKTFVTLTILAAP